MGVPNALYAFKGRRSGGMIGVTKYSEKYGFSLLDQIKELSVSDINPPLGMKTMDWVAGITK